MFTQLGAGIQEHVTARLEQPVKTRQHFGVIRQVLYYPQDGNGVEFLIRLVLQDVDQFGGDRQVLPRAEFLHEFEGLLRNGNAGYLDTLAGRVLRKRTPAHAHVQHFTAGRQPALFQDKIHLPTDRLRQRFIRRFEHALGVTAEFFVQERKIKRMVALVVRADGSFVDRDLAQQQWGQETPQRHEQVTVLQTLAQIIDFNHVPLEVEPAVDIGIGDNPFIKRGDGADAFRMVNLQFEPGRTRADPVFTAIQQY